MRHPIVTDAERAEAARVYLQAEGPGRRIRARRERALHLFALRQPRPAAERAHIVLAHLGRPNEAHAELGRLLAIDPKLTIATARIIAVSAAPEFLDLYVSGLRLAGLPEE